jgi:hypothetical protein
VSSKLPQLETVTSLFNAGIADSAVSADIVRN